MADNPYSLNWALPIQAFQNLAQNRLAQEHLGMEQERLGFERQLQPFKVAQSKQAVETAQLEHQKNVARHFGGVAQAILNGTQLPENATPEQLAQADQTGRAQWQKIYNHPEFNEAMRKSPFGYNAEDWKKGAEMLNLEAQGWQDPEQQKLIKAHAAQFEAEANKAGYISMAPGTNLVSIAPQGSGAPPAGNVAAVGQGAGAPRPTTALSPTPTTADVTARMNQAQAVPQRGAPAPGTVIASTPMRAPPGYELDPTKPGSGEYRPIIGGPADIKFTEAKNKALFTVQSSAAKIDDLVQNITEIQNHPGLKGNFGVQGVLPNFPGSQSSDALAKLQQLKAQGSFSMLQAMRDASKSGGALGNVSDAEGARLEAAFGALQRSSSLPQAMQELEKVKQIALRSRSMMLGAFDRQYGAGTTPAQTPTHNAPGSAPPAMAPRQGAQGQIPPGAVKALLANPQLAPDFDAKYGAGKAQEFLTQR